MRIKLLACLTIVLTATKAAAALSVDDIEHRIRSTGAAATIAKLESDGEWEPLLKKIGQGGARWVALVPQLAPGSDAASAEGLTIVLASALPHNPEAVLRAMSLGAGDPIPTLKDVCGIPFIETPRAFNDSYRRSALRALGRVRGRDLSEKRDLCAARLKE